VTEESVVDIRLKDALAPETRSARKALLAASFVGVAVAKVGIVPTKLSTLGLEFEKFHQKGFVLLIAILSVYFLASFFVYALSDFLGWKRSKRQLEVSFWHASMQPSWYSVAKIYSLSTFSSIVVWLRCLIDFFFPIFAAAYAIYILSNLYISI